MLAVLPVESSVVSLVVTASDVSVLAVLRLDPVAAVSVELTASVATADVPVAKVAEAVDVSPAAEDVVGPLPLTVALESVSVAIVPRVVSVASRPPTELFVSALVAASEVSVAKVGVVLEASLTVSTFEVAVASKVAEVVGSVALTVALEGVSVLIVPRVVSVTSRAPTELIILPSVVPSDVSVAKVGVVLEALLTVTAFEVAVASTFTEVLGSLALAVVLESVSLFIVPRVVSVASRPPTELVVSALVAASEVPLAEVVDVLVASVELPGNSEDVDGGVPVVVVVDVLSEAAVAFVVSSLAVAAELHDASEAAVGVAAKVVVDVSPAAEEVVSSVALAVVLEGVPVASVVVSKFPVAVPTELVAAVPSGNSIDTLVAEVASASSVLVDVSGKEETVLPSAPAVASVAWT
jgi:hypothetical protein